MQHGSHFVRRQIDVGLTVITGQKSVTITMTLNGAFDFIQQTAGLANILDKETFFLNDSGRKISNPIGYGHMFWLKNETTKRQPDE
jgi:hypothetical protein